MSSKSFWISLRNTIYEQLKGAAVKAALIKFLGTAAAGGFKAWLITFIVKDAWKELGEPLMKAGAAEVGYVYAVAEGKVLIKRLDEAKESGNETDYKHTIGDILN